MALDERRLIRDAMDRLLTGQPIRSTGALTVVALAEEADVKRHLLTHRHPDLKDEFYAKVRAQGDVPQNELDLRARVADLEAKVESLRSDRDTARAEAAILRRMNNVLAAEKAQTDSQDAGRLRSRLTAVNNLEDLDLAGRP
ncbi:hypothetical protein [uncultured Friedmanniella sp.]|uniref:hypothetical protein n=1 Tax=uncultured Friedmanniella sp. TaxID=335381 RepID=UPI0035CC8010